MSVKERRLEVPPS